VPEKSFPKTERLRRSEDIQQVLKTGRRYFQEGLQLLITPKTGTGGNRAGFIVKRKLGSAVCRNLMKRRMREAYRDLKHRLRTGHDLVISATKDMEYASARRVLEQLLAEAGVLEENDKNE
jgi:ribonuclease P protein component